MVGGGVPDVQRAGSDHIEIAGENGEGDRAIEADLLCILAGDDHRGRYDAVHADLHGIGKGEALLGIRRRCEVDVVGLPRFKDVPVPAAHKAASFLHGPEVVAEEHALFLDHTAIGIQSQPDDGRLDIDHRDLVDLRSGHKGLRLENSIVLGIAHPFPFDFVHFQGNVYEIIGRVFRENADPVYVFPAGFKNAGIHLVPLVGLLIVLQPEALGLFQFDRRGHHTVCDRDARRGDRLSRAENRIDIGAGINLRNGVWRRGFRRVNIQRDGIHLPQIISHHNLKILVDPHTGRRSEDDTV